MKRGASKAEASGERAIVRALLERLRAQRLRRNWTQAELARRAGISVQSYQNFETGHGNITLGNLLRILGILGFADRLSLLVPEPEEERTVRGASRPPRQRARSKAPARGAAGRQAGDLVLPPPEPRRPADKRVPPSAEEIAGRLRSFCQRHGITRLEIFGSVARGEAVMGSDVDLIARFPEHPGLGIVSIEEECGELLGVPVHLLTFEAVEEMTNPFRKESIQQDRRLIYAA